MDINISEQREAVVTLVLVCIICGPFYLSFLAYGFARRKKLVISSLAKWVYIASFPLALAFISTVSLIGAEEVNASSVLGDNLYNLAAASLVAGALAAAYILFATSRANHKAK